MFFSLLLGMMLLSSVAFGVLDTSSAFDSERVVKGYKQASSTSSRDHKEVLSDDVGLTQKRGKFLLFLALQASLCFISNGAFPSIQVTAATDSGPNIPISRKKVHLSDLLLPALRQRRLPPLGHPVRRGKSDGSLRRPLFSNQASEKEEIVTTPLLFLGVCVCAIIQ